MKAILLAAFALVLLGPAQAFGGLVHIDNPSFEDPVSFTGSGIEGRWSAQVPEWDDSGDSIGVFEPTTSGSDRVFESVPDGQQTCYLNGGYVFQDLTATLLADTLYTLRVAVGDRYSKDSRDLGILQDFRISLYAGSSELAFLTGGDSDVADGQFEYFQVQYLALADDPLLGSNLRIQLANTSGGSQVNYDDVSLSADAVPVPAAVWLLGSGLLGLVGLRKGSPAKTSSEREQGIGARVSGPFLSRN